MLEPGVLGATCVIDGRERVVAGDALYISDEVPRLTPYEKGFPGHVTRIGPDWQDDPLILDERWVAVRVRDRGLVVLSGCSHAGIINVLAHASQTFPGENLLAVIGGFHLSGPAHEPLIEATVKDIGSFGAAQIFPGHCTGWRAVAALSAAYPDAVSPLSVGQTVSL